MGLMRLRDAGRPIIQGRENRPNHCRVQRIHRAATHVRGGGVAWCRSVTSVQRGFGRKMGGEKWATSHVVDVLSTIFYHPSFCHPQAIVARFVSSGWQGRTAEKITAKGHVRRKKPARISSRRLCSAESQFTEDNGVKLSSGRLPTDVCPR